MTAPRNAAPDAPTDEQVAEFAFRVWSYKQGEVVSLMIHLGDRLGLYRAMASAGTTTAEDLAERTGLHPRWVLEWLRGQAAADLVHSADGNTFSLDPAAVPVLVDEERSVAFAAGAFGPPLRPEVVDRIAEAFRTGVGITYDERGPEAAHGTERMLGPWARSALVPRIVPALEGVVEKLDRGATVADVGCGGGVAVRALAGAFPRSTFHGFDPSRHAIARARTQADAAGLTNAHFHEAGAEDLQPGAAYDLVLAFDCLHDMTHPQRALDAIRRAIDADGTLLVKEIRCAPTFAENRRNPMLALLYGFSVTACMASALSSPDGAGLGTVGLHGERLRAMCDSAGFTRFKVHDFDDPANLYYEVRP